MTPLSQRGVRLVNYVSSLILCAISVACGSGKGTPTDAGDGCLACATLAVCDDAQATSCRCPDGYAGDGTTAGTGCRDVDECATGTSTCDPVHGTCRNNAGGYTCGCAAGFTGDGTTAGTGCTDIDECATGTPDCDNFACVNTAGSFRCDGLYAIEPFDGVLARLDPKTFGLLDLVPLTSTGTVGGVTAMARHPVTGTVYVIAKVNGVPGRAFGTIDLASGAISVISSVDRFSSLEFLPDGTLHGVTGAHATVSKTLYTIDTTTGVPTLVGALGHGADGEVICYDSDAALMYHWTGGGSSIMESFPLATPLVVTNVSPGISGLGEVFGCRYLGGHTFLVHDIGSHVRTVTSAGVISTLPDAVAAMFQDVRAALPTAMTAPHTVRPIGGPAAGGTEVTLRGIGLSGATAVAFGGAAAASFTVVDDTTITAVTAAGAAGTVDVVVTTPRPFPASWPAAYTFAASLTARAVTAPSALTERAGANAALERKASRRNAR